MHILLPVLLPFDGPLWFMVSAIPTGLAVPLSAITKVNNNCFENNLLLFFQEKAQQYSRITMRESKKDKSLHALFVSCACHCEID